MDMTNSGVQLETSEGVAVFAEAAQDMTITEICNGHYLPEVRTRRKPNTVYGYESSINLHVLPRWGHLRSSTRLHGGPLQGLKT